MNHLNKRLAAPAYLLIAIIVIALYLPFASAATSLITIINITPDPFYINVPNANPPAQVTIQYKYNSGGWATADLTEQIKNDKGETVYEFGNSGADTITVPDQYNWNTLQRIWDGKANLGANSGKYVAEGTYTFYVKSHVNAAADTEAVKTFEIANTVAPKITLQANPPAVYYNGKDTKFPFSYAFAKGSGILPVSRLKIKGPTNKSPQEITVVDNSLTNDGNYTITWDGNIDNNEATTGDYTFTLDATTSLDIYTVNSNVITGNFKLVNAEPPSPTVDITKIDPNPYSPTGGNITFNYTLDKSLGFATINAGIYDPEKTDKAIKSWNLYNQASGNNSLTWDGKGADGKAIVDGSYVFKIGGEDGSFTIVPQQTNFTVTTKKVDIPTPTPPTQEVIEKCADFKDVDANDSSCEAVEYVKSIGAMTGNPDGTFNPQGLLQRDQIVKIVLETFGLFNKQNDYCNNSNTLPDVTKGQWAYQYVCRGLSLGVITGYLSGPDMGYYRPSRSVNRVEFLAIVLRNLQEAMPPKSSISYKDVKAGQWYSGYSKYSFDNALYNTSENLNPGTSVTRVEVAKILFKLHQLDKI